MLGKYFIIGLLLLATGSGYAANSNVDDESWIYGKWQLNYDPDGASVDWLEFLPNGDAWSIGPNGKIQGIYIVDGDAVKAVFTWKDKDFIMNFRTDKQHQLLKIITSRSGKASIYKKMDKP